MLRKLSVFSLAALSFIGAYAQDDYELYHDSDFTGSSLRPPKDTCVNLNGTPYAHHIGSVAIQTGFSCTLYRGRDCSGSSCTIGHWEENLFEYAPCSKSDEGYHIVSVKCGESEENKMNARTGNWDQYFKPVGYRRVIM